MDIRTIKMLKDQKGAPNGVIVRPYYEGETYDLPKDLSQSFVEELRVAKYVDVLSNEELEIAAKTAVKAEIDAKFKALEIAEKAKAAKAAAN